MGEQIRREYKQGDQMSIFTNKLIRLVAGAPAVSTLLLVLTACGADDVLDQDDLPTAGDVTSIDPAQDEGEAVNEETVAEITVGAQTVTFLRWGTGGEAQLALRVTGSVTEGDVLSALYEREGELTMLEIFQALSPAGSTPPDVLVEAHDAQRRAIARPDGDVRQVDKILPPNGVSPCDDRFFFPSPFVWNPKFTAASAGGTAFLCTGSPIQNGSGSEPTANSCTHYTTARQRVGICKANAGPAMVVKSYFGNKGGSWSSTANQSLPSGEYMFWEFAPSATERRLAAVGISGVANGFGLRSGIGG